MKYFQPKSLTWWSGILLAVMGVTMLVCDACEFNEVATVIASLNGGTDASPSGLILMGLGFIGVRDKMERLGKTDV